MRHVQAAPEVSDFAEHDELGALLQDGLQPADAFEPHQLNAPRRVGELRGEPPRHLLPQRLHLGNGAPQLHVLHFPLQFAHRVEAAAVHVAEGEMLEQIAERGYTQLNAQQLRALGANAFEVLDGGIREALHGLKIGRRLATRSLYHMV